MSSSLPSGSSAAKQQPQRTFYKRTLPDSCTLLSSRQGRQIFASAMQNKGLQCFFPLMEQFTTQSEPAFCGLSTLVMTLNAFAIDPKRQWKGTTNWRWYEESMLNCCLDLEVAKQKGITLNRFVCLATCQGIQAQLTLAAASPEASLDHFREQVKRVCTERDADTEAENDNDTMDSLQSVLVVSYSRKVLGQTGTGHFSPIAAYDAPSDRVLILDTARFKYGPHWVPLSLLFEATLPLDPDTNQSRGYVLLSNNNAADHQPLPQSVLFQSQMNATTIEALEDFKRYLRDLDGDEPTWEEMKDFWTKGGSQMNYIWQVTQTKYLPTSDDESSTAELSDGVLSLIGQLEPETLANASSSSCHTTTTDAPNDCVDAHCRPNYARTIAVRPLQAIFVVYLACQSPARRMELVRQSSSRQQQQQQLAQQTEYEDQLLAEAELIEYAIRVSDQTL